MNPTVSSTTPSTLNREALLARANRILNQPTFTKEDSSRCEQLLRLADSVDGTGRALRDFRIAEIERDMGIRGAATSRDPRIEAAFRDFLKHGKEAIPEELRALAVGTDSAGGFITPQSFADAFLISLQQADQLFTVATLAETAKGTACNFPIDDDTQAVATIVAENQLSVTTAPVVFDHIAFGRCPMWRSGHIIAPLELAADSAFDLSTLLAGAFGRRFARGCGAAFTATLLTDADVAVTSAANNAITVDECLTLVGALDAAFAMRGAFLMAFSTYIQLLKQKGAGGGAYLVEAEVDDQGYPTLFGRRVYLSPSMPAIAANAKSIAYGDLTKFIRRQVRDSLLVKVYNERYATSGQIAYEGFLRTDGKLAKATNSPLPVRLLQCHA